MSPGEVMSHGEVLVWALFQGGRDVLQPIGWAHLSLSPISPFAPSSINK